MDNDVLISIVVPVKNGDCWLEKFFQGWMKQTLSSRCEIIVIDSGSTDRSLEIIRQYPAKLVQIPAGDFNHGDTRNLGVREAKGKYVVMTVQDASPVSEYCLQHFVDAFENEKVAAVCGQQVVPHDPDKNPVWWFRPVSAPQKRFYHYDDPQEFLRLSPAQQRAQVGWDNVISAYRRDILLQHPFPRTDFAEDILWARAMLLKGYTLGNIDDARVFHYHHYTSRIIPSRYFSVYYFEYKTFGVTPADAQPVFRRMVSAGKVLLKESAVPWPAKLKWLAYNITYWREIKRTMRIFNKALNKGEQALDVEYQKICKKVPQALKY